MAVTFDNAAEASVASTSTTVSVTVTVGAGANRAAQVGLGFHNNAVSAISVSGAGATWTLVTGTDTASAVSARTMIFGARGLTSGSQTVTATWTGASECAIGIVTAAGVDQTTPVINGTNRTDPGSNTSVLAVTTAADHLAVDVVAYPVSTISVNGGDATQTQRWNDSTQLVNSYGGSSDKVVSGVSASMGWLDTIGILGDWAHSGADFNPAAAAATLSVSDDILWRGPAYLRITPQRTDDGGLTPPAVTTLVQDDPYRIARMNAPAVRIPPTDWSSATIGGAPAPSAVPGDDTRSKPSLLSRVLQPQFDSGGITTSPAVSAVSGDDVRSKLPLLIKPPQPGFDSGGMFTGAPAPSAAPGDDTRSKPPLLSRIPQPAFDAGGIISTPAASAVPGDDTRSKPPFLSRVPQTGFESGGMTSTPAASAVPGDDPRQSPRWLPKSVPPRVDDAPQTTPLNISTDDPAVQRIVRAVQLLKPKFDSDGIFAPAAVGAVLTDNEYRVVRSLLVIYRLNQIDFTSDTTKLSAAAARLLTRLILGVGL